MKKSELKALIKECLKEAEGDYEESMANMRALDDMDALGDERREMEKRSMDTYVKGRSAFPYLKQLDAILLKNKNIEEVSAVIDGKKWTRKQPVNGKVTPWESEI